MKLIYKILIALFFIGYFGLFALIIKAEVTTRYCGEVTSTYRTPSGYKVSAEAHVVFYCDSLKRKVDVEVSNNAYVNTVVGQNVCYKLSKNDLRQ